MSMAKLTKMEVALRSALVKQMQKLLDKGIIKSKYLN